MDNTDAYRSSPAAQTLSTHQAIATLASESSSSAIPSSASSSPIPKSILILGSGVFGLSTAKSLLTNPRYSNTALTIIDAYAPTPNTPVSACRDATSVGRREITASLDTSRIIRPDYSNALYAKLADEATDLFRKGELEDERVGVDVGGVVRERTYTQPGLVLISSGLEDGRGRRYVEASFENVMHLAQLAQQRAGAGAEAAAQEPRLLPHASDVENLFDLPAGTLPGQMTGYINPQAGWANASAGIEAVTRQVLALFAERKVKGHAPAQLLHGTTVTTLLFSADGDSTSAIRGAKLDTGEEIHADLTILATGAWTSSLLPSLLAPRLRASGQALAYISLHGAQEVARYAGKPTIMDMETGMFAIFPPEHYVTEGREEAHVKVARHGWGYAHTRVVHDPLSGEEVECYLPPENGQESFFTLPSEAREACRAFTALVAPDLASRPFSLERVCWYTDTPTCDFLIDWVQGIRGLLVASGGSGHGYKFLPVLGNRVVERMEGRLDKGLAELWRWRNDEECEELWRGEGDASRGGKRGMWWNEEREKSKGEL